MEQKPPPRITDITRRDLFEALLEGQIDWSGRLNEILFLSRLYDLASLPSTDGRFGNAEGDILQHRVNNWDWEEDWIFADSRFGLMHGSDEVLLNFLCETLHPAVRPDSDHARRLCDLYNGYLKNDGFQLVEKTRISGKPVFAAHYVGVGVIPAIAAARYTMSATDPGYLAQQITRMEAAVISDPTLAIGTAKELVESCCKTILTARSVSIPKETDLIQLVKLTTKELELTPAHIPDKARAADTMKKLLNNLATITQGIAELRNHYGTGHGKVAGTRGLSSRHAKLAVGAASTLAVFLAETHNERTS